MYLKTLRMRGFKSFAQSVELRFEHGIAVVVGPNGSGCLLYTSPSPRDISGSRMPSSA